MFLKSGILKTSTKVRSFCEENLAQLISKITQSGHTGVHPGGDFNYSVAAWFNENWSPTTYIHMCQSRYLKRGQIN